MPKTMFAIKVFLLVGFCLASSFATPFSPCDSGAVPLELRVDGCDAEPCPFYRGTDLTAEWDFAVVADTDNLKPRVFATALGVTIPYVLPQQNACKSLTNGECPLDEGEEVTYGLKMPILPLYPKVSVGLEFALVDNDDNVHVCFKLKAKVFDKPKAVPVN